MKVTSVRYNRGVTLRTASYESVRIEIGGEGDVEPQETFDEAFASLRDMVDQAVADEVRLVRRAQQAMQRAAQDESDPACS